MDIWTHNNAYWEWWLGMYNLRDNGSVWKGLCLFLILSLFISILTGSYLITFSDKNFDYHGKYDLMLMPSFRFTCRSKAWRWQQYSIVFSMVIERFYREYDQMRGCLWTYKYIMYFGRWLGKFNLYDKSSVFFLNLFLL